MFVFTTLIKHYINKDLFGSTFYNRKMWSRASWPVCSHLIVAIYIVPKGGSPSLGWYMKRNKNIRSRARQLCSDTRPRMPSCRSTRWRWVLHLVSFDRWEWGSLRLPVVRHVAALSTFRWAGTWLFPTQWWASSHRHSLLTLRQARIVGVGIPSQQWACSPGCRVPSPPLPWAGAVVMDIPTQRWAGFRPRTAPSPPLGWRHRRRHSNPAVGWVSSLCGS
jgi:hypothetical protein